MVGGVSSPVRSFKAVGGTPVFFVRGRGSTIWDADGNSYVDYVCSWGPLILGHSNPRVLAAVVKAAQTGTSFGAPTLPELTLAKKICTMMPSVEKVRFVNSGTEATMSALRLARAFAARAKLIKFEGCYHGHADPFLTRAGSGLATLDIPDSAGIPESLIADTITIPYNDDGKLEEAFQTYGNEVAAVIVEPIAGNMGVVRPALGFLRKLRQLCDQYGAVLIFDEVISGFRVSPGGAQKVYGVKPDLTCLGKIIGGGFPVGAYGGRSDIMRMVAPEGPMYQAGTLAGNPVAMAAGLATLSALDGTAYAKLERTSAFLEEGLQGAAQKTEMPLTINRVGSMVGLFFTKGPVKNFADVKATNHSFYPKFHQTLLKRGVYFPPSAFETIFVSTAHSASDIAQTADSAAVAFKEMAN
jgi:glutamate-1-semialdehyde 2,1-aminomutase